ncbi:MAG: hypothetical protein PHU70_08485 [Dehalococcoidia bacterium]|nr:hypothetical protein [Dehalococcoidia bacterium]MDD5648614.1 hypothetical protein [Dehalococcoidia bacterium]
MIELVPSLSNCIHTVTKKEYEDTLRQLLSGESGNEQLNQKLELLTIVLKEIDFKELRTESDKYMLEGKKVKVIFYVENNMPRYEMQVI